MEYLLVRLRRRHLANGIGRVGSSPSALRFRARRVVPVEECRRNAGAFRRAPNRDDRGPICVVEHPRQPRFLGGSDHARRSMNYRDEPVFPENGAPAIRRSIDFLAACRALSDARVGVANSSSGNCCQAESCASGEPTEKLAVKRLGRSSRGNSDSDLRVVIEQPLYCERRSFDIDQPPKLPGERRRAPIIGKQPRSPKKRLPRRCNTQCSITHRLGLFNPVISGV